MRKYNNNDIKSISRIALIISDTLSIAIPAYIIYTFNDKTGLEEHFRTKTFLGVVLFTVSILFWSQTLFEHYSVRRSFYDEFTELIQIYGFNGLAVLSSLFIFQLSSERFKHIIFLIAAFSFIPISRLFTRYALDRLGLWRLECIIFCPQSEFSYAKTAIESQFNLGMTIRRSVIENRLLIKAINNNEDQNNKNLRNDILEYHKILGSPHIIVFSHRKNASFVPKIVELIILSGLSYSIIPDIAGVSLLGMRISHFFRWEVLLITPQNNIDRLSYQLFKRCFDLIFGVLLLFILAPVMLIIFYLVKKDGGPAIFEHKRIGKEGRMFKCLKFRSMFVNSEELLQKYLARDTEAQEQWLINHKLTNDPRITNLGKFLRISSLDELPQLFNVIRGEMSLVGPRPITPAEVSKYENYIELYKKVRPGITGLWQISGRSNTTYDYRVALDNWYIKNWSLWYDLAILIKTFEVVFRRNGAH